MIHEPVVPDDIHKIPDALTNIVIPNPEPTTTYSFGSLVFGPIDLPQPLAEMSDESQTSSDSEKGEDQAESAAAEKPKRSTSKQVPAQDDLQKRIELMERTNKLRREKLEQQEKLKKLAKPFSLAKKISNANELLHGMTKPEEVDDLLSELSTPGL